MTPSPDGKPCAHGLDNCRLCAWAGGYPVESLQAGPRANPKETPMREPTPELLAGLRKVVATRLGDFPDAVRDILDYVETLTAERDAARKALDRASAPLVLNESESVKALAVITEAQQARADELLAELAAERAWRAVDLEAAEHRVEWFRGETVKARDELAAERGRREAENREWNEQHTLWIRDIVAERNRAEAAEAMCRNLLGEVDACFHRGETIEELVLMEGYQHAAGMVARLEKPAGADAVPSCGGELASIIPPGAKSREEERAELERLSPHPRLSEEAAPQCDKTPMGFRCGREIGHAGECGWPGNPEPEKP